MYNHNKTNQHKTVSRGFVCAVDIFSLILSNFLRYVNLC